MPVNKTALQPPQADIQCNMISRTSEIPDLNKYVTKTLENDCFVDLEGDTLCLSYLLAVISEKTFASYVFLGAVHMSRASPANQADSILSPLMGT